MIAWWVVLRLWLASDATTICCCFSQPAGQHSQLLPEVDTIVYCLITHTNLYPQSHINTCIDGSHTVESVMAMCITYLVTEIACPVHAFVMVMVVVGCMSVTAIQVTVISWLRQFFSYHVLWAMVVVKDMYTPQSAICTICTHCDYYYFLCRRRRMAK